jgi:hypothetical protein
MVATGRLAAVAETAERQVGTTTFAVSVALSVSHLLNDTIQSLIAAVRRPTPTNTP